MPTSRKAENSGRNFTVPVSLIVGLLVAYVLLIDWHTLPLMISTVAAAFL